MTLVIKTIKNCSHTKDSSIFYHHYLQSSLFIYHLSAISYRPVKSNRYQLSSVTYHVRNVQLINTFDVICIYFLHHINSETGMHISSIFMLLYYIDVFCFSAIISMLCAALKLCFFVGVPVYDVIVLVLSTNHTYWCDNCTTSASYWDVSVSFACLLAGAYA